jgi:hypothetical protein
MLRVGIEQTPNHALVLRVMFAGFSLKILDASLAQRDGHFHSFVTEDKFFRAREEVRNDSQISEGFVRISYSHSHRFACLSASSRLRKSELHRHEM